MEKSQTICKWVDPRDCTCAGRQLRAPGIMGICLLMERGPICHKLMSSRHLVERMHAIGFVHLLLFMLFTSGMVYLVLGIQCFLMCLIIFLVEQNEVDLQKLTGA